ncbi:MAG: TIGR01777 family oxidoreductase [Proteobacteria bacterium]|nr:TIGR01777 family oxidoreductase [Pseudomonadota bacterium]
MKIQTFVKRSIIDAPAEDVFEWHAQKGAIRRLSPPWSPLKIISKTPGVDTGTQVRLKIKTGPVFSTWNAVHTACEPGRMFRDTQVKGPFKSWNHTHRFIPSDNNAILEDRIEFALPFPASHSRLINKYVHKDLERIFTYRHAITQRDLFLHRNTPLPRHSRIAITGASGLIGSRLVPFLTTGGHEVYTLVRRKPDPENLEIFWDPEQEILDPKDLEGMDVVIHLAGENIGEVRWTDAIKHRLTQSRVKGTTLLSNTLARLEKPPKVFLCASAIGYYGHTGDTICDESSQSGNQYISSMCKAWEDACEPAIQGGIRTANMRIGVVYSPEGGALSKLLPLFNIGLGASMGSGSQFISWISMEDTLYAMHHLITDTHLYGPVNLVAPNPQTNKALSRILAKKLKRPALFNIPESIIRARFGQMGEEILLSSARIHPEKLLTSGYSFIHPEIDSALNEVLGV